MSSRSWFIDVETDSTTSDFLDRLSMTLEHIAPQAIDPASSRCEVDSHGSAKIMLVHRRDPQADIEINFEPTRALTRAFFMPEEYWQDPQSRDFVDEMLDDLTQFISYDYDFTTTSWDGRQVRQRILRLGGPPPVPDSRSVAGWWLPLRLIPRHQLQVTTNRVSYDCAHPVHAST